MKYLKYFESNDYPKVQIFGYKIIKTEPIENLEKYKNHRRLKVFFHKGTTCCECGVVGTILTHGVDKGGNLHIDLCTDDYYPLTIDHILPKSKGGPDHISNLRPMCCLCNFKRGNDDGEKSYKSEKTGRSSDIKVGDIVYKNISGEKLGEVIEIVPNYRHPKKVLSCRIKERDYQSLYDLNSLHKR